MTNENGQANKATGSAVTASYRPKLAFYHANPKGTGAAIRFELHPAHDDVDGSVFATLANQLTIGDRRAAQPVYPRFDWENSVTVKLDFSDLTKMLQVFRGECESIEEGKGLFHQSLRGTTTIKLSHVVEVMPGYVLEIYRGGRPESEASGRIFFHPNEALGLAAALESSMGVICFGIPTVIPHDTSSYRNAMKEKRNAPAA